MYLIIFGGPIDNLVNSLHQTFGGLFFYIGAGIAFYGMYYLLRKMIKKIRQGKVEEAKEAGHELSDKIVDFLVKVIEKYDLKEAKQKIKEEAEGNEEIKTNI